MDVKTAYEQWLHDFAADADTIADLKAIANDPAEIEDRFYTELSFGTAGMRGVLGAGMNRMNRYNVRRATKGLAKYLLQNPQEAQRGVVIAYDSRRFSAEFARDAALVLAQEGVPAYLFDALRPVPILSYAVRHLASAQQRHADFYGRMKVRRIAVRVRLMPYADGYVPLVGDKLPLALHHAEAGCRQWSFVFRNEPSVIHNFFTNFSCKFAHFALSFFIIPQSATHFKQIITKDGQILRSFFLSLNL